MALAPREGLGQQLAQRALGVDRARVDVQQRRLAREAPAGLADTRLLAHEVEQVGGVAGVEDAEAGGQAEDRGVAAHEAMGDGVERAAHHAPGVAAPRRAPEVGPARPSISRAARRVNVSRSTRSGAAPWSMSHATRAASVVVLPVPAPASTSSGPPGWVAAASCSGFRASR